MEHRRFKPLPPGHEIFPIGSAKDVEAMIERLFESWDLLLQYTSLFLGSNASREDAEDTLSAFINERAFDLWNRFDIARGRFDSYFIWVGLRRFCMPRAKKITQRAKRESSLTEYEEPDTREVVEWSVPDESAENDLESVAIKNELKAAVEEFIGKLPPRLCRVFMLSMDGFTAPEIASLMDTTCGAVRTMLCRLRKRSEERRVGKEC